MTNTIPNVLRELLEELRDAANESMNATTRQHQIDHFAGLIAKADALLSAPSPASVDGLSVVAVVKECAHLIGDESDEISAYLPVGTKLYSLPVDAQAIIDGLRGEVDRHCADLNRLGIQYVAALNELGTLRGKRDQQAQRIGELERALLEVAASLAWNAHGECRAIHDGPIMPSKMAIDAAKAALSAGKEGE